MTSILSLFMCWVEYSSYWALYQKWVNVERHAQINGKQLGSRTQSKFNKSHTYFGHRRIDEQQHATASISWVNHMHCSIVTTTTTTTTATAVTVSTCDASEAQHTLSTQRRWDAVSKRYFGCERYSCLSRCRRHLFVNSRNVKIFSITLLSFSLLRFSLFLKFKFILCSIFIWWSLSKISNYHF